MVPTASRHSFPDLPGGPAMRYVVVIMSITLFLIWDVLYNQSRAVGTTVREVHRVVRMVTG
jgi:hypothetical protein